VDAVHEAWEKLHTWTSQTLPRIIGMWAKNPEVVGFYRSLSAVFRRTGAAGVPDVVL
jgi:hypothetical protein